MKRNEEHHIKETDSDTLKVMELQRRVAELERLALQKQVELDFKDKMIDIAEEVYHVDIKTKFGSQASGDSESSCGEQ